MSFGPGSIKSKLKASGNLVKNRKVEVAFAIAFLVFGCVLLWDAFEGRGKNLPWPFSGLAPY